MQRYFADSVRGNNVFLSPKDAHHLVDVVRIALHEQIEVVAGQTTYLCSISHLDPLEISIGHPIEEKRELDGELLLAFAVLKGDHNDLVVEKGTELGCSHFIPFLSERTIIKVAAGSEDSRILRLKKIAESSAQQCRRLNVPKVDRYADFDQVLSLTADQKFFAYEEMAGQSATLFAALAPVKAGSSILVVVGPEGGFTIEETKKALEAGFTPVSLGRRILRAETASLASLSLISAFMEAK